MTRPGKWLDRRGKQAAGGETVVRTAARSAGVLALLPYLWSVVLAVLLLGPALGQGFVLTYDMVWVPDLALGRDALGLGSALPRAVPSDAVVAVLDEVVPGTLLQKLVLLGALVGAGWGSLRLVGDLPLAARLFAVSLTQWNPFVAERLLIGHWPVLVTYAVLPWLVVAARRRRDDGRLPGVLWFLVPLASLSASGGLVTAVVLLALAPPRTSLRGRLEPLLLLAAANAPWLVSGLLHAGSATTDAAGAELFALGDQGALPAPLAALGLGGIWNGEVVPGSVAGTGGWLFTALVVVLAGLGARGWWVATTRREARGLVLCWAVGWGLAVLTWALPGAPAWLGAHVPGAGLLRDGSRLLLLCAPLLVVLTAHGAVELGRLLRRAGPLRGTVAAVLVVLPVTLLPGLALGAAGRLDPVDYPTEYAQVRDLLADRDTYGDGDVLLLPLSSYRQPGWNDRRKVLDPLGRYLRRDYVASDVLVVSGRPIDGEDPRVGQVAAALGAGSASRRSRELAALGVAVVVVDERAPGNTPALAGETLHDGARLRVLGVPDAAPRPVPTTWELAMGAAWVMFVMAALAGLVSAQRRAAETRRARWSGNAARGGERS
jgi:hypothetical protein